ncbi:MAG: B12-binding domain-containing radical SAM protein [Acidobacteria bacterium]|nr:B12-binding domain-containing radical SAM protein [Acidobacteriota bacterium]
MKILLVKPYSRFPTRMPHLGLGYLATALRRQQHDVDIADCPRENLDRRRLQQRALLFSPDVLGISAFSSDLTAVRQIAADFRRSFPQITLVLGGAHASALPEHCFTFLPELDFVLRGEAEHGLPPLVRRLQEGGTDWENVPGLAFRKDERIIVTSPRLEQDLDSLGFPAWDLLRPDIQTLAPHGAFVQRLPVVPIITTRGCPFPCTFCAARCISGRTIRHRSLENIFEEIDYLVTHYGVREIHIEDDNFTFRREFALGFCEELLRRGHDLSWCCPNGVRLDTLDRELLTMMKRAGCYSLSLGIEAGTDHILQQIRKGLTTEQITRQVALIAAAGIKTTGFFMIGFPGETRADIRATLRFARHLPLDRAQFSTFLPLPGTDYFEDYLRACPLEDVPWDKFFTTEVVWPPAGISPRDMARFQRRAFLGFYLRPAILAGLAREIRSPRQISRLFQRAWEIFK